MKVYIVYEITEWEDGYKARKPMCICLDREQAEIERLIYALEYGDMVEMNDDDGIDLDYCSTYEIAERTFEEEYDNTIIL